MNIPTRPLEQICFFPIEFPVKEGKAFCYIFMDVYSTYVMLNGTGPNNDTETVLKNIKSFFTQNKDFLRRYDNKPFTLILHKYEEIEDEIIKTIKPLKGTLVVNDPLVGEIMLPTIEALYQSMADGMI